MNLRTPLEDIQIFEKRRIELGSKLKDSALVLTSNSEPIRNHDVHYPFRQDSNFYYLTGFEEPESIFVFRPGLVPETVMFVRKRDPERETWDGFRFGPEGVESQFGIEKAYPIEEFEKVAPELLKPFHNIYYRLFKNPLMDRKMESVLNRTKALLGRTGYGLQTIHDSDPLIGEMRLFKSHEELAHLKKACEISVQGHLNVMGFVKPGMSERQIHAQLIHHFLNQGAAREGYNSIVASGAAATTLHYQFNDQICKNGDLLLIDAGAEYKYYTADITRTFPVNGKFTDSQAQVYEGVLNVQKKIIGDIKPGIPFQKFHEMASDRLTDLMLELGFFDGRKEDIIKSNKHRKYYPHGIGHWLGMDVHDSGLYFLNDKARCIEPNMCFTIEPGIYIPIDDIEVSEKYRGIGVRIEDNIVVTSAGCEVLTASLPKEITDLEKIIGQN